MIRRMFPAAAPSPSRSRSSSRRRVFCVLGIGLTWRVASARLLRWTYIVYFAACTAAFAFASPIGENIARLRFRRGADRDPDAHAPPLAPAARLRDRARTCPLVESDAARRQLRPQRRRSHRARRVLEADDLLPPGPRAGPRIASRRSTREVTGPRTFSPARGSRSCAAGSRQEDFPQNRVLYGKLGPGRLRELAAQAQRPLRRAHDCDAGLQLHAPKHGCSRVAARGSRVVHRTRDDNRLRAFRHLARSITPAGTLLELGYTSIRIAAPVAGTYRLDVTYAPYWHTPGGLPRAPAPDGMTELTVRHPGIAHATFRRHAQGVRLAAVVGDNSDCR